MSSINKHNITLKSLLQEIALERIEKVNRTKFIENVLGIKLSLEESTLLLEGGILSQDLEERIQLAELELTGFLDTIAKKIGGIPKDLAKNFNDAASFLKFLYNVISDPTGKNIMKAIVILQRNAKALFAKIDRAMASMPENIKELAGKVIAWIKKTASKILGIKSDVDSTDELDGDMSNWKKFIMLLLVGMLMIFLLKVPNLATNMGVDFSIQGLENLFTLIPNVLSKIFTSPLELAKVTIGPALVGAIGPIIVVFKGAKLLASVQAELLDSNAWLQKTPIANRIPK